MVSHLVKVACALPLAATLCTLVACGSDGAVPVEPSPVCVARPTRIGEHFAWDAIRTGNPPIAADPNALRGSVTALVNVGEDMLPAPGGHVELWASGRVLSNTAVTAATPRIGDGTTVQVSLPFNTANLPNGSQTLEARLVAGTALSSSCPTSTIFSINQRATINNN